MHLSSTAGCLWGSCSKLPAVLTAALFENGGKAVSQRKVKFVDFLAGSIGSVCLLLQEPGLGKHKTNGQDFDNQHHFLRTVGSNGSCGASLKVTVQSKQGKSEVEVYSRALEIRRPHRGRGSFLKLL